MSNYNVVGTMTFSVFTFVYRDDYLEMFAPRCGGCGRPILDNYISALSRHWHPECFACRVCITINFSVMKGYSLYWNEIATKKWLNHKPIIWQTQKSQTTDGNLGPGWGQTQTCGSVKLVHVTTRLTQKYLTTLCLHTNWKKEFKYWLSTIQLKGHAFCD